jgi:hypothetical protein
MKNRKFKKYLRFFLTGAVLLSLILSGCSDADSGDTSDDLTDAGIVLWTGQGFTGDSKCIQWDSGHLDRLPDGFAENLSSVEITGGSRIGLFTEENRTGDCLYVTESMSDLGDFNNSVKSIAILSPERKAETGAWVSIISIGELDGKRSMKYVSHERRYNERYGDTDIVVANREDLGEWEQFYFQWEDPNQQYFSLRTTAGTYVCAEWSGSPDYAVIYANRPGPPQAWEFFRYEGTFTNGINYWQGYIRDFCKNQYIKAFDHVYNHPNCIALGTEWPHNLYDEFIIIKREPIPDAPLIMSPYTADPSAHVFDGKIYIYPSIDPDFVTEFNMTEYRVFSMDSMTSPVQHHGQIFSLWDIPWVEKDNPAEHKLWAPDCEKIGNEYFFFFPGRGDNTPDNSWRIGVARSLSPDSGFTVMSTYIDKSYSIDQSVFTDPADGSVYLIFGGLWGGELEKWPNNEWHPEIPYQYPSGESPKPEDRIKPAVNPRIAKMQLVPYNGQLWPDFAETVKEMEIHELWNGSWYPMKAGANPDGSLNDWTIHKTFFEAPWMNKVDSDGDNIADLYVLSYSTGLWDWAHIAYATSTNIYGPYQYQGYVMRDIQSGITNHHSIVEFPKESGNWYLFYQNAELRGENHQRCIKFQQLPGNWYQMSDD